MRLMRLIDEHQIEPGRFFGKRVDGKLVEVRRVEKVVGLDSRQTHRWVVFSVRWRNGEYKPKRNAPFVRSRMVQMKSFLDWIDTHVRPAFEACGQRAVRNYEGRR